MQTGPFGAQLHADDYVDDGTPLILIRNIRDGRLSEDGLPMISHQDADRLSAYALAEGDIVFSRVGRVGSCFLTEAHHAGWIISGQLLRMRIPKSAIDHRYLLHALQAAPAQEAIADASVGTTRTSINTAILEELLVPVPPLREQRRIAEVLDTIDDTIRATERIIKKRELVRLGVTRDQLRAVAGNQMSTVQELVDEVTVGIVVRPTQYYASSGIPVLRSANVREDGLVMTNLTYMSPDNHRRLAKTSVAPGDLLTVRTGYPGITSVVPPTVLTANCVDVVITRVGDRIEPEFLALWINSEFGKGHVLARQGGLAQQHFNVGDMKPLPVPIVERSVQRRIVDTCRKQMSLLATERRQLVKLRRLREGLVEDLLSGRVRTVQE